MLHKYLLLKCQILLGLIVISATGCLSPDPKVTVENEQAALSSQIQTAQHSTAPDHIDPNLLSARAFNEAPEIAQRVQTGDLPPVSDRLPDNPLIVVPLEKIGVYGGTIRRALTGDIAQSPGVSKAMSENLFVFSRPMGEHVEPNVAEHCEFKDGGRTAIITLRKGIKWSDGYPLTVDDILFLYEDMLFNENARALATPPSEWIVDGKPLELKKRDDHTLEIHSPKPLGRLLYTLASTADFVVPKHYWKQFHPKYTPGADYSDFRQRTTTAQQLMTPGVPRLSAWVSKEWVRGQRLVYERNPYYWKVDSAGNQLPYTDRLVFSVVAETQVILLKFMNGEMDLFGRYSDINMFEALKVQEKRGGFKILISGPTSGPAFYLNWDVENKALREAFRNKNVRIALSHAINREEINQILYKGFLEISGYAFLPSSSYFSEEAYKKYTKFDPELSKRLLDEAGYRDSDGDGVRELKNGDPFAITIDFSGNSAISDIGQLVSDYWAAIGIKVYAYVAMRDIIWPRRINGEFQIHQWSLEGPGDPLGRIDDWAITGPNTPFWHRNAYKETQPWFQEASDLMHKAITTIDTAQARTYMERARDLHAENVPVIVVGSNYRIWGKSNRLGNVPNDINFLDIQGAWGKPIFHEQIFIKKEEGE